MCVLPWQLLIPERTEYITLRYTSASHPVIGSHAVYLVLTGNIWPIGIQLKLTFTMAHLSALLPHTVLVLFCVDIALPPIRWYCIWQSWQEGATTGICRAVARFWYSDREINIHLDSLIDNTWTGKSLWSKLWPWDKKKIDLLEILIKNGSGSRIKVYLFRMISLIRAQMRHTEKHC